MVSGAATPEESGPPEVSVVQQFGDTERRSFIGTRMVVNQDEPDEWEECACQGLTKETDASVQGWGAVCKDVRIGGLEQEHHINYIELPHLPSP